MAPKVGEVVRRLVADGWILSRQTGSHQVYAHPTKPGIVVIAGKASVQLQEGTWKSIKNQAGWQ